MAGREVPGAELRQLAEQRKTAPPRVTHRDGSDRSTESGAHPAPSTRPGHALVSRIQLPPAGVAIDAQLANWDGDAESDGVALNVLIWDANGEALPVTGTLDIRLLAPIRRRFHAAPHARGQSLEAIARWSHRVTPADLTERGVALLLPFGAVHPELDRDNYSFGQVHVTLVVPGWGVVERRLDLVRIRPYSPLRDRLRWVE